MKTYSELGPVHRNEPCVEYPGTWSVYHVGILVQTYESFDLAYAASARLAANVLGTIAICWSASENDPRIGEVWFTPFYQHGRFDSFGEYLT